MDAASLARVEAKVRRDPNGCWTWTGALTKIARPGCGGYPLVWLDGKATMAHRAIYAHHVGSIAPGMTLDHLCRNRACVNPAHLEPVLQRTNILRGVGPSAANAVKSCCPKDHPYDGANLYVDKSGRRHCRQCRRERSRLWWAANGSAYRANAKEKEP